MTEQTPRPDPAELMAIALRLAAEAGELIEAMRAEAGATSETKSSVTDVVTAADKASEKLIIDGILAQRPHDGILGEEGGDITSTSGVRWLIDPIDGTTNYVYDIPAYSVSIAAELDGSIVAGVVYDPRGDRMYSAVEGCGAFVSDLGQAPEEGRRLAATSVDTMATALVGTGFGYRADRRRGQAEVLVELLPHIRDIRRFGSAALDLCAVAEGWIDAYFERGLNPWDLAAGWLIATESGAVVEDLRGGPPNGDFVVAAGPALFEPLRDALVHLGADTKP